MGSIFFKIFAQGCSRKSGWALGGAGEDASDLRFVA